MNIWVVRDKLAKVVEGNPVIKPLYLYLPSDVIVSLIFNEKIKVGELRLSITKPSIILSPYYVVKTLKEWDLLAHETKLYKDEVVLANSKDNICDNDKVVVTRYDISKRLIEKKFVTSCGVEYKPKYYFVPSNERIDSAREGLTTVLYRSEAEKLNVTYFSTGLTVDFHLSLFKNFSDKETRLYEGLKDILLVV